MRVCKLCGKDIPWRSKFGDRSVSTDRRRYCLDCNPVGSGNANLYSLSKYKVKESDFREMVANCQSISRVLQQMGLVPRGGNYKTFKSLCERWNVDTSHFTGKAHVRGKNHCWSPKLSLEELLVLGRRCHTSALKKRLINEGVFERKCYRCGNTVWLGEPIPLELEHKNGDNCDNRLHNLTLLCPNCHAKTPHYRGRNIGRKQQSPQQPSDSHQRKVPQLPKVCKDCGKGVQRRSERCRECQRRSREMIEWPSADMLRRMVQTSSYSAVARKLNVSDNAVRKRLKNHVVAA